MTTMREPQGNQPVRMPADPLEYNLETEPDGPVVLTLTECRRCNCSLDSDKTLEDIRLMEERLPAAMFRFETALTDGCPNCQDFSDHDLLVIEEKESMNAYLSTMPMQWHDPEEMEEHQRLVKRWTELGIWQTPEERRAERQARNRLAARQLQPASRLEREPVCAGELPF